MGQQQLLLVILVTIIVGIATVVAINTFGSAADNANIDAVRNDMATVASSAQAYYMKPTMLAGGGRTFTGLTFQGMAFPYNGISADSMTVQNENGTYTIAITDPQTVTLTANPASDDAYIPGTVDADGILTVGTPADNQLTGTITADGYTPDN